MNIEITPALINSIGLGFDIIGVWLVAVEVIKQFKGKKHKKTIMYVNGIVPEHSDTDKYITDKKQKHKLVWFGLFCLTIGFVLQIISNFIPSDMYKTPEKFETQQQRKITGSHLKY